MNEDSLLAPTQCIRFDGDDNYFIVDCWHHRIIYSSDLHAPISKWNTMVSGYGSGHTVAYDGNIYVTDETERNKLHVFRKTQSGYIETQIFDFKDTLPDDVFFVKDAYSKEGDKRARPHYVLYVSRYERFFVALSYIGCIAVLVNREDRLELERIYKIEELQGVYFRSLSFDGEYFYTAQDRIYRIQYDYERFHIVDSCTLPDGCSGIHYFGRHDGIWFLTYQHEMRCYQEWSARNEIHSLYRSYEGLPYYLTEEPHSCRLIMTEISMDVNQIHLIKIEDNQLISEKIHRSPCGGGNITLDEIIRYAIDGR